MEIKKKLPIFVLCLLCVSFILFWGLRPFNFNPRNGAAWLKTGNGINFHNHGIVYGPSEFKDFDTFPLFAKNEPISIELWLTPGSDGYDRFSYIFCLYDGQQREIFSLSQVKSLLKLSIYQNPENNKSAPHRWRWLKNTFFKGQKRFLTLTSDKTSTTVYWDGRKVIRYRNYPLMFRRGFALEWRMIIGNDPSGTKPWAGKIHGLAIYNHALPAKLVFEHFEKWRGENALSLLEEKNLIALYPMDERDGNVIHNASNDRHHLLIPHKFKILKKDFLQMPGFSFKFNRSAIKDMGMNIVGFVPLGLLLMFSFNYQSLTASPFRFIGLVLLSGIAVSFIIEICQAYLPTRNSSLLDLIFNALGMGFGVFVALVLIKLRKFSYRIPQS